MIRKRLCSLVLVFIVSLSLRYRDRESADARGHLAAPHAYESVGADWRLPAAMKLLQEFFTSNLAADVAKPRL